MRAEEVRSCLAQPDPVTAMRQLLKLKEANSKRHEKLVEAFQVLRDDTFIATLESIEVNLGLSLITGVLSLNEDQVVAILEAGARMRDLRRALD